MKDWKRIREAIDACGPEGRDLDDPALKDVAELVQTDAQARKMFQRSQQFDARVCKAIHEVDIPVGLEQRLLSQFAQSTNVPGESFVDAAIKTESPNADAAAAQPAANETRPVTSRRRFWMGLTATAAAAAAITLAVILTRPSPLTLERLGALATDWTKQAMEEGHSQWRPVDEEQISPLLRSAGRWKSLETDLDQSAKIFDLTRRSGKPLFVFQFQPKQDVVPLPQFPYKGVPVSGQWHMGAWEEPNGVIYIAVSTDRGLLDSLKAAIRPA